MSPQDLAKAVRAIWDADAVYNQLVAESRAYYKKFEEYKGLQDERAEEIMKAGLSEEDYMAWTGLRKDFYEGKDAIFPPVTKLPIRLKHIVEVNDVINQLFNNQDATQIRLVPELRTWLNDNTPGWKIQFYYQPHCEHMRSTSKYWETNIEEAPLCGKNEWELVIEFKSPDDAMLCKLMWG